MAWRCSGKSNTALIDNLYKAGIIKSERVCAAMASVDRALYLESSSRGDAYQDSPSYIGFGATISAPHMHAYALEMLESRLRSGARALDVGSGSGYLTVCMAEMVGKQGRVFGIEHISDLVARARLSALADRKDLVDAKRLQFLTVDGFDGLPDSGPYDAIHVGAAAPHVPTTLVKQLKKGGRMIIPVGPEYGDQYLMQIDKGTDGSVKQSKMMGVRYVPLTTKSHQLERRR